MVDHPLRDVGIVQRWSYTGMTWQRSLGARAGILGLDWQPKRAGSFAVVRAARRVIANRSACAVYGICRSAHQRRALTRECRSGP